MLMDAGTLAGDIYYEIGMEIMPDYETVGRIAIKMAWGYYRSAENLEGMKNCEEFLKEDLNPEAKALAVEHGFDKLARFSAIMETDGLGQKLMNDSDGVKVLKLRIKPKVRESLDLVIKYLNSEEFRGF